MLNCKRALCAKTTTFIHKTAIVLFSPCYFKDLVYLTEREHDECNHCK